MKNEPMKNEPMKIVYIDMDDVIVDFRSGIDAVKHKYPKKDPDSFDANWDEVEGIFALMSDLPGAVDAVKRLAASEKLDVYILSSSPWNNPGAWAHKVEWIHEHFDSKTPKNKKTKDNPLYKKLILSHNKHLNAGAILIDDRKANGAKDFGGLHIHFGKPTDERLGNYPNWDAVLHFFEKEGLLEKQGE